MLMNVHMTCMVMVMRFESGGEHGCTFKEDICNKSRKYLDIETMHMTRKENN